MQTASNLDRRVTIERYTVTDDGYGSEIHTWYPLVTVAASRADLSDAEKVSAGAVVSIVSSRFLIRDQGEAATVKAWDRLSHDGQIWNIAGVKQAREGRNRFLEISANMGD